MLQRFRQWLTDHIMSVTFILLMLIFVLVYLAPNIIITIPAGHVGVLWKRFENGTVTDPARVAREGNRLILPWDKMFTYDMRLQRVTETYEIISSTGLAMTAEITFRYRLDRANVGLLHKYIGPSYLQSFLIPKVGASARAEISRNSPEQVYSTNREAIQRVVLDLVTTETQSLYGRIIDTERLEPSTPESERPSWDEAANLIVFEDVLIRGIVLPELVRQAIERKVEQYHVNLEYDFRLERERKESERKAIEARGIQEFQRIVSSKITPDYLRWKGIDATLQLALSNNTKIVVIGSGADGLPIILGNVDGPGPQQSARTMQPPLESRPSYMLDRAAREAPTDAQSSPAVALPNQPVPEGPRTWLNSSGANAGAVGNTPGSRPAAPAAGEPPPVSGATVAR